MENQQGPAGQHRGLCSILCNNLMVTRGKGGGRDSQGVWDGHGHTAVFNMENQQGPAVQHRGLCSILCNNVMVTRGKGGGRDSQGVWDGRGHMAVFNMENQQGPAGQHRKSALLLLLLLSRFSRVRLCASPETAAHQAPPSLGFSRQEHWSGLPFPSPMHESEK